MNKLNEEELINVSGGSISQVLDDVKHLKAKGLIAKDYNLDEPEIKSFDSTRNNYNSNGTIKSIRTYRSYSIRYF